MRRQAPPPGWGVTIDDRSIDRFAEDFEPMAAPPFAYPGLPREVASAEWWDYIVLSVSCIACLWAPEGEPTWSTEFEGEWLDDAPGYFAAFTKESRRGGLDLGSVAGWSIDDVQRLFAGRGVLQLLPERLERLTAVAGAGLDRWRGTFARLVEEAAFDGPAVARLLVETVPGYRDEVETEYGTLRFWKLAHLATAMMSGNGPSFAGLESFPVYPDYMVPRTLRHHGILRYDEGLSTVVDSRQLIPAASHHELAIRWATMHACERILQRLAGLGKPTLMPSLDYRLWHAAVLGSDADRMGEHHRTVTMFY